MKLSLDPALGMCWNCDHDADDHWASGDCKQAKDGLFDCSCPGFMAQPVDNLEKPPPPLRGAAPAKRCRRHNEKDCPMPDCEDEASPVVLRNSFLMLTVAQVGDVATTWHGISLGIVREANPLGVLGLQAGLAGLIVLKLLAMGCAAAGALVMTRSGHGRSAATVLRVNAAFYLVVVAWNIHAVHG